MQILILIFFSLTSIYKLLIEEYYSRTSFIALAVPCITLHENFPKFLNLNEHEGAWLPNENSLPNKYKKNCLGNALLLDRLKLKCETSLLVCAFHDHIKKC